MLRLLIFIRHSLECGGADGGEGVGGWSMPSLTGFNIELFKVVKTQ